MANGEYPYVGAVFPSPLGNYFFNVTRLAELLNGRTVDEFPSPLGDYFLTGGNYEL